MYDVYIFDLDGTLLDTLDDLTAAVNYALRTVGAPERTRDEVRAFVGNGMATLINRALPDGLKGNGDVFQTTFQAFKSYYTAHCTDQTHAYEGIMPLLERLKAAGKQSAIVSNKGDFAVKELSERFFGDLIAVAVGENEAEGIRKKPAPDSVFAVLRELNAENKKAVYIGDSEVDIETAKNASLPCITVTWGFRPREFLIECGATLLADTPDRIFHGKQISQK